MGKFIMERISMKKRFPLAALILCLIFGMSVQVTANTLNSSWAESYIDVYKRQMINEELKQDVMNDIVLLSLIGVKVVLVHGGGPEINDTLKKIGKKSEFVNGLRVTAVSYTHLDMGNV